MTTTKTFDHAEKFYNILAEQATREDLDGISDVLVFRGKIGDLYKSLGASQSYYSKIRGALLDMGCISIYAQGARDRPTVVILHHPPEATEFRIRTDGHLTERGVNGILAQRVDDIHKRLGGLDIVAALKNFEERLTGIETRLSRIEQYQAPRRRTSGQ